MENMISGIMGQTAKQATADQGRTLEAPAKTRRPGRPKVKPEPETAAETGCKIGETRTTTILDKGLLESIKRLAYWDRRNMKTVISMALEQYVEAYEKKNGKLKPIPEHE